MKYQVKQIRSQISSPQRQQRTLQALGLGKIGRSRVLEATDSNIGMLRKVQHLISITKVS